MKLEQPIIISAIVYQQIKPHKKKIKQIKCQPIKPQDTYTKLKGFR